MALPAIGSLQHLRDLPLRVQVSDELRAQISAFASRTSLEASDPRAYYEAALTLTDRALAFLDAEAARLTQERFAASDPGTLRQRFVGEPKRLADGLVANLKSKVASEKAEWSRRLTKQSRDVAAAFEHELAAMETSTDARGEHALVLRPSEAWSGRLERWIADAIAKWTGHLAELVRGKHAQLLQPDLDAIQGVINAKFDVTLPEAPAFASRFELAARTFEARFEAPSTSHAIFETFKNGLNTVAMLAGLIVIPVIGSLMHESPLQIRAVVMGATITPVALFAVLAGVRTRKRLLATNADRAREQIIKALGAAFKDQLERFRAEAERYCSQYGQQALHGTLAIVEPAIAHQLERRERDVAQELAGAQLAIDRINEQLMAIKQSRTSLSGQLVVELRRKLTDG